MFTLRAALSGWPLELSACACTVSGNTPVGVDITGMGCDLQPATTETRTRHAAHAETRPNFLPRDPTKDFLSTRRRASAPAKTRIAQKTDKTWMRPFEERPPKNGRPGIAPVIGFVVGATVVNMSVNGVFVPCVTLTVDGVIKQVVAAGMLPATI